MSQSVSEFWAGVRDERDMIFASIQKQDEQPQGAELDKLECRRKACVSGFYYGSCYIISLKNRDRGTLEGDMCEATINLAGQRIAEGTHRLATDSEILNYKAEHKRRNAALTKANNESIRIRTGQRQVDPSTDQTK